MQSFAQAKTPNYILFSRSQTPKVSRLVIIGGANPNARTTFLGGAPLLAVAAKRGFVDVVSLLLEFNARVDLTGSDGVTAFEHAAANGHVDILRLLYGKGAKVCSCV